MAVSAVTLKDTDFETVVKVTTTGTNTNASIVDASALEGAESDPRLAIVACQWTTGNQTNILFDATSNDHAISVHGSGELGFHGKQPLITNPESSGVTGDILITNSSAVTGTFIIEVTKSKGYDASGQTR